MNVLERWKDSGNKEQWRAKTQGRTQIGKMNLELNSSDSKAGVETISLRPGPSQEIHKSTPNLSTTIQLYRFTKH